jgi:succinyl-CoA synthetase alpha subunit
MSILVNKNTKVITQGHDRRNRHLPHRTGAALMARRWLAGVTPGKGGDPYRPAHVRHRA